MTSLAAKLSPGDAIALSVIVPPSGTGLGLVTTSWAWAESPTPSAPSAQSTGPLPEHPSGADAVTRVVPAGRVSTTCASARGAIPSFFTVSVYCTSLPAVTGSGESAIVVVSSGATTVVVALAGLMPGGALAVLTTVPPLGTVDGLVTTTVAVADAPGLIEPSPHVTDVVPVHPPDDVADTKVVRENRR